jgi:hypothetical protein
MSEMAILQQPALRNPANPIAFIDLPFFPT